MSELVTDDTRIGPGGAVTGTLKYIQGWADFSDDPEQQTGHFFPVHISDKYQGKQITCKGEITRTASDLDWVLFVKSTGSKFTFECEGETILTLTFTGATLAQNTIRTARRVTKKTT